MPERKDTNKHVQAGSSAVPQCILKIHRDVVLSVDIMFVNKIPFLVTSSCNIHFSSVESLPNRQVGTIATCQKKVTHLYHHQGFCIKSITCDPEFEVLQPSFPMLNCCMAGEHVPEIERYICTLNDRTQSAYNVLPFKNLPWAMLIHPFKNGTLWLNAFPAADGMSSVHSPHFLLIGRELSFDKHAVLELGSYVQTHEEHSNGMEPQTMGAICLGPMGNAQGGHWFFSLTPGCRVVCHCWTALPMPQEVFLRVSQIGCTQGMPSRITYANRQGDEISDRLEDFFDEDDASSSESDDDTYTENWSHQDSEDDETTVSNDETTSSDDDDDDDPQGNPHPPANETHDPAVPDPAGSFKPVDPDDEGDEGQDDENRPVDMDIPVIDGIDGSSRESEEWEGECENDAFSNAMSTEEIDKCEGECESDASSSVASSEVPPTESEQFEAAEAAGRAAGNSQVPSTESEQFEAAEAAGRAVGNSHDDARRKSNHGE